MRGEKPGPGNRIYSSAIFAMNELQWKEFASKK